MKKEHINNEVISSLKKMVLNATEQTATLTFLDKESNYRRVSKMDNESVRGKNILKDNAGGDKLFYTTLIKQKNIIEDCSLLDECFAIVSNKPEWSLKQETKK